MKQIFYILVALLIFGCGTSKKNKEPRSIPLGSAPPVTSAPKEAMEVEAVGTTVVMAGKDVIHVAEPMVIPTAERVKLNKRAAIKPNNRPDKNGQLVYSLVDTMKVGISHRVVVRIINGRVESYIQEGLKNVSEVEYIRTSSTMQVEMVDPDKAFSIITSNNSQVQIVDSIEYTEWVFNVTPIKSGRHPLSIVSSIITENGRKDRTYSNAVFVKSNIIHQTESFWDTEWKWIFTTLIIPLIGWWYKNRKSKDAE